ncbi:P-loop containing nucleoside triphosphate hydrolase protein [Hypoxylon trugodes]|uniref:P-loop containing nucleoside triphosphate hydrolase protein n=1 Tax=Hypoxylon trugodes TaxID=326681 RepID=UPI00218FADAE|nr:P-loop containing nucleoside triphosphate hydrolase protein [Hypoxylon trugodes]KAI1390767.1 P-loop containing nucleoside triphosphate hydrolase protein [Hypoxylon trugodes]
MSLPVPGSIGFAHFADAPRRSIVAPSRRRTVHSWRFSLDFGDFSLFEEAGDRDSLDEGAAIKEEISNNCPRIEPVDLRIRDLSVYIRSKPSSWSGFTSRFQSTKEPASEAPPDKTILNDINLDIKAGTLTAIVGVSGSGKTTLLNIIAERFAAVGLHIEGSITFNWQKGISSTRSGYVRQEDLLMPTLTVRRTLMYASKLRDPSTPASKHATRVDEMICELGLKSCADTAIKQCSGGEKRRTSIGIQLLGSPSILLLDEPTTGLDATSALAVVSTLQRLAKSGRTIITTIHQPRSDIINLFDKLVVMSKGGLLYAGQASTCVQYFENLGYIAPQHVNPVEFVIGLAAVDYRTKESEDDSKARIAYIQEAWKQGTQEERKLVRRRSIPPTRARTFETGNLLERLNNFRRRVTILTRRNLCLAWNDKASSASVLIGALFLGIVAGLINLQLGRDESGIRSRQGALYTAISIISVVYLEIELWRLVNDIRSYDQECEDGLNGAAEFVFSRRISALILEDIPIPLIFSIIFYFLAGLREGPEHFGIFFLFVFLAHYAVRTWAMVSISLYRDYASASLITGLFITIQTFCGGFLIQVNSLPVYVGWLRWIAYCFYAFSGLASNEFAGDFYDCPYPGGEDNPLCQPFVGDSIIASLGFRSWVAIPIIIILAFIFLYIVLSLFFLYTRTVSIESAGKPKTAPEEAPEPHVPNTVDIGIGPVQVQLEDLSIYARNSGIDALRKEPKCIVQSVNITFAPGSFTAIMGPSGSGKTTLLKSIAYREQDKYRWLGNISINGTPLNKKLAESICSYVPQHDVGLLPTLTVRETLRYAALLRLPREIPTNEKYRRAEEILHKLGLKDCASVRVGDQGNKGISGGERRRVSIGIQLLSEPQVLILDEPTSGLDGFAANSILSMLKSLAEKGCTVLTTVHQTSVDDFNKFDNVVLMAKGGRLCYAGRRDLMLPYFEQLGHFCPQTESPADFASDLLSGVSRFQTDAVDSQEDAEEQVNALVSAWPRTRKSIEDPWMEGQYDLLLKPAELLQREASPFWCQYGSLLRRSMTHHFRTEDVIISRFVQAFSYGVLLTLFFAPLRYNQAGVQTHAGYIQLVASLLSVGLLQNAVVYPAERDIFYYERADKASSVEGFLLQYTTLEIGSELIASLIFSVLAVFAAGLPRTVQMYFIVVYNTFLLLNCGESLGIIFFTIFDHGGFALTVASLVLTIVEIMSGVITPDVPAFIRAITYISPTFHGVSNLLPFALRGSVFFCDPNELAADGSCAVTTGEEVLDLFHMNVSTTRGLVGLAVCVVVYRLIAYILLKAKFFSFRERLASLRVRMFGKSNESGYLVGGSRIGTPDNHV